jgi:glycosyltransferase involved in cell wall biosynthesis
MVVHQAYSIDGRVVRYADALAEAGVSVDVLCLHDPASATSEHRPGIRVLPIPLKKRASRKWSQALEYVVAIALFGARLSWLHLRRRYDLVHVHNMPDVLALTAVVPKLLGAKVILDIHDPMPEFFMSKFGREQDTSVMVRLMKKQERLATSIADAIITANDGFKKRLVRRGIPADKITVVRNIADPSIFNRKGHAKPPRRAEHSFVLVYPGTIARRYGVDVAIQGLALLGADAPRVRLVVHGREGSDRRRLEALVGRLELTERVAFKPLVPIEELPGVLESADAGIYPALPDAHMSIAEPGKVLEYAAMGLPIISSRVPVLEETFGDSAIAFFAPGDPEDFARCVVELARSRELRQQLVRNADAVFVQHATWEHERTRYLQLVWRLAGVRNRSTRVTWKHEEEREIVGQENA